jgi:glycosyltransferase involved in cell wall biosynthesis
MRIAMLLHKSVQFDARVRREASALAAAGHEVIVLELAPVEKGAEHLDGFARRSVTVPRVLRRLLPFHLYRVAFMVAFVAGIARAQPDVVHAHDVAMLAPALVGARIAGARVIYEPHELATGVPYRDRRWAWFVSGLERVGVRRCAAVITVSDGVAARLQERYRLAQVPTVIRNISALRPDGRTGLRARLGLDDAAPLVLHQGAPAPDRGCDVLVRAVASLPGARLVFLGDPDPGYGDVLSAEIHELGLSDRVSMLPSVALEDLLAHTAEADVGVTLLQDTCENHRLALPNKLFEYLAAGLPVVASALPEVCALVQSWGVGWCVVQDDPRAVAVALQAALDSRGDEALRGRISRAAAELSWEREQRRLISLYGRLGVAATVGGPKDHQTVGVQKAEAGQDRI